jgi:histidyl-tRNA synthetase
MQYAPYVTQDYFMMDDIDKVSKYLATSEFHQLYNDCTTEHKQVLNLQPPSGTRDFHPWQMDIRDKLMTTIRRIFKNHGGQEIDTPVFERRSTLIGQYGDNDKLIYELMDQGGVELALRYDLTVPFARYVAANNITDMKRFHIGKVYRRDNPSIATGRYREFYQCDLDICGKSALMISDAEILHTVYDVLTQINVTPFVIKLNHRRLLTEILTYCGADESLHNVICSSIDKLDKQSWESVRDEILLKGLDETAVQLVGKYMTVRGELFETLEQMRGLIDRSATAIHEILNEMEVLFKYLTKMKIDNKFEFDLSLARGLSYYTGIIFEAVAIREVEQQPARIGSIAAGGRYDNLIGMFCGRKVPAVGCSFGIERLVTFAEMNCKSKSGKDKQNIDILVHGIDENSMGDVMAITAELWTLPHLSVQFRHAKHKMQEQIEFCLDNDVKYMIVVGSTEIANGTVNFKEIATKTQVAIKRECLLAHVQTLLH